LTTEANELTRDVHDRMPVILDEDDWERWLDTARPNAASLKPLLQPFDSGAMKCEPVSTHVNSPRNDDPECVEVRPDLLE
jgi:putative SOS response-associated peptidase YedK